MSGGWSGIVDAFKSGVKMFAEWASNFFTLANFKRIFSDVGSAIAKPFTGMADTMKGWIAGGGKILSAVGNAFVPSAGAAEVTNRGGKPTIDQPNIVMNNPTITSQSDSVAGGFKGSRPTVVATDTNSVIAANTEAQKNLTAFLDTLIKSEHNIKDASSGDAFKRIVGKGGLS